MATERRTSRGGGNPGGEGSEWLTLGQAASYLGVSAEHGPQVVGRRTPVRLLHARWTPALSSRRSRLVPRRVERRHNGDREKRLVLVVDDDEQLREFVRVNLEMDGYLVREARSAAEGLTASRRSRPTWSSST